MKIIICGAGQVGGGIAERLAREGNDVTLIDKDPQLVQLLRETLDVRGIVGHGAQPDVLQAAGAQEADMVIAVTLHDEVNMVACQVAHSLFNVPTKVARIRAQTYLEPHWQDLFSRDHMPIDVIISPEVEVGEMILKRLSLPRVRDVVTFCDEHVVVACVHIGEDCPIIDTPLTQLTDLFPDLQTLVVGIVRGGTLFVPRSNDSLLEGDVIYFVAERSQVTRTLGILGHDDTQAQRAVIAGGGNIGLYIARALEGGSQTRAKLIERDHPRAIDAAEQLDRTVVLNGSALDQEVLREADIDQADIFIAVTDDDKVNLLACAMAKTQGAGATLCLINDRSLPNLATTIGFEAMINPRAVTVSKILQHVRRGRIRGIYSVYDGEAEIIEAEAMETSPLVGSPLNAIDWPDGVRVGAVYRDGRVVVPRGDTRIMARDRVLVFALEKSVRRVEQMFRVSIEYF